MNYQNFKKHLFYPAFAAILTGVVLTMSNFVVKSQRTADFKPSPFKFDRLPEPKKENLNNISLPMTAGNLDPTFGTGGKLTTDFGSTENANAVAVQTDGKIVAAGTVYVSVNPNSTNYDFAVFRYNADGSLDTSFDADGKVTTEFSGNSDIAFAVAVQTDGKIIAAGGSFGSSGSGGFALVRYNTDGSLDNSFGTGGKVITQVENGAIYEIAVQTDGKIVAAGGGSAFTSPFTIARYNPNGSLDASFGTGGIVTTNFGNDIQRAYSVVVQTDGKIVAAGDTGFCDGNDDCFFDFALARYNTDGSPDTSFDTDGKLTTTFGVDYESANAVVIQADGKIVAAGYANGFAVARYNGDGSLDTSFDGDGKVTTNFGGYSYASSVALQSNGKIVVSGSSYVGAGVDFALVRLNTDGSLDTSFDTDGKLTTDFGNSDGAYDVAIQADGKIVAAGNSSNSPTNDIDFALSRYNADGSLDNSFDGDGKQTTSLIEVSSAANAVVIDERVGFGGNTFVAGYSNNGANDDFALVRANCYPSCKTITPIGNSDDRANAAAIDPSGRIVAAGYSFNGLNNDFALVRYFQNLGIDTSFGTNGKVTTDFGGTADEAKAVAIQADGKIVVVGQTIINGDTVLALARYNNNGSLDTSFGTGGKVIVQSVQNAKAMAIQPDGKIIAAGNAPHTIAPFGDNFALARFNPDGSLDTSFDGDGIAVTRFDFASQINALALQPYGKIVAAGFTRNKFGTIFEFALARYNANGSLDTSFDADGKVTTSFGSSFNVANAVSVQRNGKIVAIGVIVSDSTFEDFALARYNGNGSLDTTFDTDGKQTTDFFGSDDVANAIALQPDGKIVAAGSAYHNGKTDFAAARYIGDAVQARVKCDYDGDGLADLSVFRPSNGVWYLNRSTQGFYATQFGLSNDKITPADFDGDGKTDIAVFRDGVWYLRASRFVSPDTIQFGLPDDIPVPADYTGDGHAELAIYRGSVWWTLNLNTNYVNVVQFGLSTDKPVPADYDGDGRADQAVYRGSGEWHLNRSLQGYTVIQFGLATDKPVPADYDGDGKTDLAVYRNGTWYILQSSQGYTQFQWGIASDIPAPADYDGDGRTDAAIYRNGVWYLRQSTNGISIQQFGLASDIPVSAAFLP